MQTRRRRRSPYTDRSEDQVLTAGGSPPGMGLYARWWAVAAFDDLETGDGRWIGEVTWREGTHPFKAGHPGFSGDSQVIGHVDQYAKVDGVTFATGVYYDTAAGREHANLAVSGGLKGVSAEPGSISDVWYDEDPELDEPLLRFNEYEVGAIAQVSIPAFDGAGIFKVELLDEEVDQADVDELVASASSVLDKYETDDDFGFAGLVASSNLPEYPAEAFALPESPVPMPLTVFDNRSYAGHLAIFGTCHTAFKDRCVTPPRSKLGYTPASQSTIMLDSGAKARVGRVSIGSVHAPLGLNPRATADFYDNEANGVAFFSAVDGEIGIWLTGHIMHDVDEKLVHRFASAAWSGDWRKIRRSLELIGVLSVNNPGFPIPDPAMHIAGDEQRSLVASGAREVAMLDRSQPLAWARDRFGLVPMSAKSDAAKLAAIDRTAKSLGLPTKAEEVAAIAARIGV